MTRPTLPPDAAGRPDTTPATPKRTCQVAGCDRPHKARGMCYPHWKRQWRAARKLKPKPPPPPTPPIEQAVRCLVCGDLTPVSKLARAGGQRLKACRRCRTVTRQSSAVGDVSAVTQPASEPHRVTVTCTAGCCWTVPAPDTSIPQAWALAEAVVSHLLRAPGCTGRPWGVYDQEAVASVLPSTPAPAPVGFCRKFSSWRRGSSFWANTCAILGSATEPHTRRTAMAERRYDAAHPDPHRPLHTLPVRDDECPHGDDAAICPPCQDAGKPYRTLAPQTTDSVGYVEAKYASRCPGCDDWIEPGDRIGNVEGEWVCWGCA